MRCPKCNGRLVFVVDATVTFNVTDDGKIGKSKGCGLLDNRQLECRACGINSSEDSILRDDLEKLKGSIKTKRVSLF